MTIPLSGMLVIPGRYNGPPESGNGGFACGLVSTLVDGDAEVTLRSPPPLDTELDVAHVPEGIEVLDGSTLVATARSAPEAPPAVPPPPTFEQAVEASRSYLGFHRHEFPTCFTCGPDRDDGLGIYPGPIGEVVAAPWIPNESLPLDHDLLPAPLVWAALDCPGAWVGARDLTVDPVVLGRMAAVVHEPIVIGHRYVSMAWPLGSDGRKSWAGTALIDEHGTAVAVARQTWIAV